MSNGLIAVDNPKVDKGYSDRTHTLLRFSKKGKSIAYSKSIDSYNRLTYEVLKPKMDYDGVTNVVIKLVNCIGHRFYGKVYGSKL